MDTAATKLDRFARLCWMDDSSIDLDELQAIIRYALVDGHISEDERSVLGSLFKRIEAGDDVEESVLELIGEAREALDIP